VLEIVFKEILASVWAKICACWKDMHQVLSKTTFCWESKVCFKFVVVP
jgi:hypothetical protein